MLKWLARRVRGHPATLFVERALDGVGGQLLAVREALALADIDVERAVVGPAVALHRRGADLAAGGDADQLLHRVVGDVEPIQRARVDHVHGADRLAGPRDAVAHPGGRGLGLREGLRSLRF